MNILFFGSTSDSVIVLEKLPSVSAIVTQPPKPDPTPVELWAKAHNITCLSFANNPDKRWLYQNEQQVIDTLESIKPDLIISASYGQKIPTKTLADAKFGGLNVHPSILPRWRGGDPVPWAIMSGDHQIGVSVVSLSDKFDEGLIYAQEKIPILPTDTSMPLRTKLFTIGADLLTKLLPEYLAGKAKGKSQLGKTEPRATRLSRETGFEPWPFAESDAIRIERKFRAFHPWPGVWTLYNKKRLKILKLHLDNEKLILDEVQLEGKKPVSWEQFKEAYITTVKQNAGEKIRKIHIIQKGKIDYKELINNGRKY